MTLRVLLLAALLAFGAGCFTNVAAPTPDTNKTNSTTGGNQTMAPMAVTVTVGEGPTQDVPPHLYTLSPAKLELHVGVPVNLTLKNAGSNPHDLVIQGIEGAKVASTPGGQSKSVEFTPTKTGDYKMYCTIGGGTPLAHADNGMSGTVTVV